MHNMSFAGDNFAYLSDKNVQEMCIIHSIAVVLHHW